MHLHFVLSYSNFRFKLDFLVYICTLVIYVGRLEDGKVFETKGSNEEPFEFMTLEGSS